MQVQIQVDFPDGQEELGKEFYDMLLNSSAWPIEVYPPPNEDGNTVVMATFKTPEEAFVYLQWPIEKGLSGRFGPPQPRASLNGV